jgi:NhaP-type Na+/H+ or K+/H+ antiporter
MLIFPHYRIDVKNMIFQCSTLALLCVALTTCVVGTIARSLRPEWTWSLCFLLGSCLSATDPVTVTPMMKDMRAPHHLILLILGESLVSEGAATVLYHLFSEKVQGHHYSADSVATFFLYDFILSPAFGLATGMIAVFFMSRANTVLRHEDTTIQIMITLCCAYLTYFFAYHSFGLSGVLSTLAAGIYVASQGKKVVLKPHQMIECWELLEWAISTVVFLIAGLIIQDKCLHGIKAIHIFHMGLIFIGLISVRVVVVLAYHGFRLFILHDHSLRHTEAAFLSSSGIRGALSMILSLGILKYGNKGYLKTEDAEMALRYAGGVIILSLFLGGSFASALLRYLGLTDSDPEESKLIQPYLNKWLRGEVHAELDKSESKVAGVTRVSLSRYSCLLRSHPSVDDDLDIARTQDAYLSNPNRPLNMGILLYLRSIFLETLRRYYIRAVERGRLPRYSFASSVLLYSVDITLGNHHHHHHHSDHTHIPHMSPSSSATISLGDWEVVQKELTISPWTRTFYGGFLDGCQNILQKKNEKSSTSFIQFLEAHYLKRTVYVCICMMGAHADAQAFLRELFSMSGQEDGMILFPELNEIIKASSETVISRSFPFD